MPSLVVQTSFLGDMVLTTPLIAHLAKAGPVDVVCTPAGAALLVNNPSVREVILYDKRGHHRGVRGFFQLAARLRRANYDAAYHAQGSVRSSTLTTVAGIKDRVGFASSAGRAFYTTRIPPIEGVHHAARLLSLGTRDAGKKVLRADLRPRLYPGERDRAAVDAVVGGRWPESGTDHRSPTTDHPLVALAPGSIWGTKRWPYYADLARELTATSRIVVIGGRDDAELAAQIVDATGDHALDATGKLSLLASAELIGRAQVLVTNDSAPQHLASAMNTPTLSIFGPTVPEFGFGPLADLTMIAGNTSIDCRPCDKHGPQRCPLGHWRCMREITAQDVARMVETMLSDAADSTQAST